MSVENDNERHGISRRAMLKRGAAVVAAAAAGGGLTREVLAQVAGSTTGGGTVPLRLPMGAMDHLDRKEYIHGLEIHARIKAPGGVGNDGVTCPLYAKGKTRLLPAGGLDITDPKNPVVAFKPAPGGNMAYVTPLKKWVVMNSGFTPIQPPTPEYPRGAYSDEYFNKTYTAYKGVRGIRTYDITDPTSPNLLQEFSTGPTGYGTHANFWDGGKYAYLDCGWDESLRMESSERRYSNGLMIVDISDPSHIQEMSKWWVPGQKFGEDAEYKKYPFAGDGASWPSTHGGATLPRRVEDGGTYAYCGVGHMGLFVLDVSDAKHPKVVGKVSHQLEAMGGIPHHSIYPIEAGTAHPRLAGHVISVFESLESDCREPWHTCYVINVRDPKNPKIVGLLPRPEAPPDAPYADFCQARGRFSSHNINPWAAPGMQKPTFVALAYFNAGLQIFDLTNPADPKRIAYFVPARHGDIEKWDTWRRSDVGVFIEWDRNLIWVSTGAGNPDGEVMCMSCPALGTPILEPRKVMRWTVPHINRGWDDATPKTAYFGRGLGEMA